MHIELENYVSKHLKISAITELVEFMNMAAKVEGDVCCLRGRFSVDAKSLMGLMSIDTSQGFECFYPTDATAFEQYISKFEV